MVCYKQTILDLEWIEVLNTYKVNIMRNILWLLNPIMAMVV